MDRIYACIDLKSFYASVECVLRGLDPLKTNLVVADSERTEKTICLAVSPSLKKYGIGGRARLYEVVQKVREINNERKKKIRGNFKGKSFLADELVDNNLEVDYIIAKPRMRYYMRYSRKIYNTYLKFISKEDMFTYSIDEVFFDITDYLKYYNMKPEDLVTRMIKQVYDETGITATGGIGTNLFLAKVAMDVIAKHKEPNDFGVRIAYLDILEYRKEMWNHKPISDVWRIGIGTQNRLARYGINTLGELARVSITNEDFLFKLFGINAEILIDHAWGYEPVTIKDVKKYQPISKSLSSGQVLDRPYNYEQAHLIVMEMAELIIEDLILKKLKTSNISLSIGYDISNITRNYEGEVEVDHYGRCVPKKSHISFTLDYPTSDSVFLKNKFHLLFEEIIKKDLTVRRVTLGLNELSKQSSEIMQMDLFSNNINKKDTDEDIYRTIEVIKKKYGKNAILKGMNLLEGAKTISRNKEVGGHHE